MMGAPLGAGAHLWPAAAILLRDAALDSRSPDNRDPRSNRAISLAILRPCLNT